MTWPTEDDIVALLASPAMRGEALFDVVAGQEWAKVILARFEPLRADKQFYQDGWIRADESLDAMRKERAAALAALESLRTEGLAIAAALIQERDAARAALQVLARRFDAAAPCSEQAPEETPRRLCRVGGHIPQDEWDAQVAPHLGWRAR